MTRASYLRLLIFTLLLNTLFRFYNSYHIISGRWTAVMPVLELLRQILATLSILGRKSSFPRDFIAAKIFLKVPRYGPLIIHLGEVKPIQFAINPESLIIREVILLTIGHFLSIYLTIDHFADGGGDILIERHSQILLFFFLLFFYNLKRLIAFALVRFSLFITVF